MDDEILISEIAQIKAMLNTLLDFQRIRLEHDSATDLIAKYQQHLDWYQAFYENRMRVENGLDPNPDAFVLGEKPTLDDILDADVLE